MRSLFTALSLSLLVFSQSACSGEEVSSEVASEGPVCGPCDMTMPSDFPLTEIGGMKFAVCGPRCEELIAADTAKYQEFAVSE
tara:strand:- start:314 stop:562 length:249 start_codon:yes stop_codon:yes gene_type:complete